MYFHDGFICLSYWWFEAIKRYSTYTKPCNSRGIINPPQVLCRTLFPILKHLHELHNGCMNSSTSKRKPSYVIYRQSQPIGNGSQESWTQKNTLNHQIFIVPFFVSGGVISVGLDALSSPPFLSPFHTPTVAGILTGPDLGAPAGTRVQPLWAHQRKERSVSAVSPRVYQSSLARRLLPCQPRSGGSTGHRNRAVHSRDFVGLQWVCKDRWGKMERGRMGGSWAHVICSSSISLFWLVFGLSLV